MTAPERCRIAILDPFSGIAGDMMLGALVAVGLEAEWLRALPATLGLEGVGVEIREVLRGELACVKVDFDIPTQPHGRSVAQIRALVERAGVVPDDVRARADRVFTLIAEQEATIHGTTAERVHLHEVGAVDAILDVVGAVWGLARLGVTRVACGPIQCGDGTVRAAHGVLPVPAPATLRILEGMCVRPGPEGAGELTTPTGAALARVLSTERVPAEYVPVRSGFGAGTKDFVGRANALRIVIGDTAAPSNGSTVETLVQLAADIDDMTGEQLAAAAAALLAAGALDVVILPTLMKKGRPGARVELLATDGDADRLEKLVFRHTSTLGVRRTRVSRRRLARQTETVDVDGHTIRIKVAVAPGGVSRSKPEADDVQRLATALGVSVREAAARVDAACGAARARSSTPGGEVQGGR